MYLKKAVTDLHFLALSATFYLILFDQRLLDGMII